MRRVDSIRDDLLSIFYDMVEPILQLLRDALRPFLIGEIKAIMALAFGGFPGSPYLMKRIRQQLSRIVGEIVSPPDPGSTTCQGAARLGIAEKDIIISLMQKDFDFQVKDPEEYVVINDNGMKQCDNFFKVFVQWRQCPC